MYFILCYFLIFQGIVYIDKDVLGWKLIVDVWLESWSFQEIYVSFILQLYLKVLYVKIFSFVLIY